MANSRINAMCAIIATTFMEETELVKLQFGLLHKFREKQKRNVKKKTFRLIMDQNSKRATINQEQYFCC